MARLGSSWSALTLLRHRTRASGRAAAPRQHLEGGWGVGWDVEAPPLADGLNDLRVCEACPWNLPCPHAPQHAPCIRFAWIEQAVPTQAAGLLSCRGSNGASAE